MPQITPYTPHTALALDDDEPITAAAAARSFPAILDEARMFTQHAAENLQDLFDYAGLLHDTEDAQDPAVLANIAAARVYALTAQRHLEQAAQALNRPAVAL